MNAFRSFLGSKLGVAATILVAFVGAYLTCSATSMVTRMPARRATLNR